MFALTKNFDHLYKKYAKICRPWGLVRLFLGSIVFLFSKSVKNVVTFQLFTKNSTFPRSSNENIDHKRTESHSSPEIARWTYLRLLIFRKVTYWNYFKKLYTGMKIASSSFIQNIIHNLILVHKLLPNQVLMSQYLQKSAYYLVKVLIYLVIHLSKISFFADSGISKDFLRSRKFDFKLVGSKATKIFSIYKNFEFKLFFCLNSTIKNLLFQFIKKCRYLDPVCIYTICTRRKW